MIFLVRAARRRLLEEIMKLKTALMSATVFAACMFGSAQAAELVVGFSQIGSESGWRAAETTVTKEEAKKRGIDLKFADAQQKQENQIKAIRSFIAQGVNAILLAPVVETGWDAVLKEAKEADIPVILLDRTIKAPEDLYLTAVTSDQVHEGKVAGDRQEVQHRRASGHHRLVAGDRPQEGLRGSDCRQVELQDRSQSDRRLHPHQGQGSHGKLPEG
jgi:cellobiose-specific phosphotransferase system component IIB